MVVPIFGIYKFRSFGIFGVDVIVQGEFYATFVKDDFRSFFLGFGYYIVVAPSVTAVVVFGVANSGVVEFCGSA